ncbi:hypothetical protein RAS1_08980 [Phycisphaerae bacterium RAS1]|nr:hypothetical protein RAS1_08980 [Phycisphaerae bacterium RAS1]
MTLQPNHDRRGVGLSHSSARVFAALLSLALLLAGCDVVRETTDGSTAGLVDQLKTFVADFARQALAAWLL